MQESLYLKIKSLIKAVDWEQWLDPSKNRTKTLYQPHHPHLVYLRWNCLWSCHIFGKGHKRSQLLGLTAVIWKALCIDISQPSVDRCTSGKTFNISLYLQFHFFLDIFISHSRLFLLLLLFFFTICQLTLCDDDDSQRMVTALIFSGL